MRKRKNWYKTWEIRTNEIGYIPKKHGIGADENIGGKNNLETSIPAELAHES